MPHDVQWDDLNVLLAVSRHPTMTAAAQQLRVDQTTVSRRLQALERALRTQLIQRRRDGVELTEAGREVARSAELMETVSLDLERTLLGTDGRLEGPLRVTTLPIIGALHPELFTMFAERHPGIALEVETAIAMRDLKRREADVGIRWTRRPEDGLIMHKLARAELALYCASSLRERIGKRARLRRFPWVAVGDVRGVSEFERWRLERAPDAKVICRYEDLMSMHAAIRAGAGVGFLPCAMGDLDDALIRLRPIEKKFGFDVWCFTHEDLAGTARVRSFIDHVRAYFGAREALYAGRTR